MKIGTSVLVNQKGWSLVEVLIAMAIILILSMVAVPNYIAYKNKAYCIATVNDAHAIAMALADYFVIPSNTTASTDFKPAMPAVRPYITIGNGYNSYTANTLLLSASTTSAGAFQVGDSYLIVVQEGAGNCPSKVTNSDSHWIRGGFPFPWPMQIPPFWNNSGVSYFMTL